MNFSYRISIKSKTYLLVLLSVLVALILSFVTNSGLQDLRAELDDLIHSTNIERHTNKLILEEQKYRLNANGSVYNFAASSQAHANSIKYMEELFQIFNKADKLNTTSQKNNLLSTNLQQSRQSTDEYKALYLTGVSLLTKLNTQAEILQTEGEHITLQIQEYVNAKRDELNKQLSQKTVDKINNGSNIWQYTYVTQLLEKKYRSSPDEILLKKFNKDYQFMMNEWARLKKISDQPFEHKKLEKFHNSARKYKAALLSWTELNKQLVTKIRPKMIRQESTIISSAVESAEHSIQQMTKKRNAIELTLLLVSLFTIVMGIAFGTIIARSISSVVSSFQSGLLNFFQYLNKQQETAKPIVVRGNDEIATMARVVNENITKIQKVMDRKSGYHKALLEWSKVDYQDENITLNKATELSAKALQVERVSIWLFDTNLTTLTCADLYRTDSSSHESGAILRAEDFPEYFKAITDEEILIVDNAREDSRTKRFNDTYLVPLNIYSMMDMRIVHNDKLIGVICHEKIGEKKTWEADEQDFANSVLNAVSLSLEIKKRRLIQEELNNQKEILHYHAHHDALTQLPNRFLFNDRHSFKRPGRCPRCKGGHISMASYHIDD